MIARTRWFWILLLAVAVLLAGWLGFTRLNPTAISNEQVSRERPFEASHGLPGGAHRLAQSGMAEQPALAIAQPFYDFGRLSGGEVARHTFVIANQGNRALVIDRAYTTCDCTTATFSASVIPPGMVALVEVTYDPGLHAVPGQIVRRGIVLETNDPEQSTRELWMEARLK